ncbi:hypothetical protein A3Q56_08610 [Intoshia linei]|uniref:DDE-1 domain-containing protein n=1 Tax=Intoshia linei TaxID=1819745 RepID=A0A177AQZ7_9BILA|nr:hypothetical protein A3Q56_08610 [Intoshia linei]
MDETGLVWRKIPKTTMSTLYERKNNKKGKKHYKDRITILCTSNMDGTDHQKLMVVGKSRNPRSFK